jgi:multicomponent Na+:H+ antiporter subunit C
MVFALCFVLFMIGLYGVLSKKNIVKIIMGLVIMECAVNLFLIMLGYKKGGVAPILENKTNLPDFLARSVDPLPQALVLASIVIGLGLLVLTVGICIRLYEKYGTFDITEIRRLKG